MINWEYQVLPLVEKGPDIGIKIEEALDRQGEQGWELVNINDLRIGQRIEYAAVFKRPLENE